MNKNVGTIDKVIRMVLGLAIIAYGVVTQSYLGAIGLIPILTASISWCPLYTPLKINTKTCKKCEK